MTTPLPTSLVPGRATSLATAEYAQRLRHITHQGHFRHARSLHVSSIGIGTHLGPATDDADAAYCGAIVRSIELGCNLIDTAINYRHQRGERCVGSALRMVCEGGDIKRGEMIVSTKAGYLPFDGTMPEDARQYLREQYIETSLATPEEIVEGGHCIARAFLRDQLARSRANLGLETIDVFYLHNPEEQLRAVGRATFERRLRAAMETLEEACEQGHIGSYGLATWNGFREHPDHPLYLSLDEILEWAAEVGGPRHHLGFLQLPLNLKAIEAYMLANQRHGGRWSTLLQAARDHGIHVVTSAPLLQGRILGKLPPRVRNAFADLPSDVQRTLQLVRSIPGVGSVLVGMRSPLHVEENLALARTAPDVDAVERLFRRSESAQ